MSAVALSFDKDVPARQSFGVSRQCGSVPPPANDNSAPLSITPNCTVLSFFQAPPSASSPRGGGLVAPRAPRFGAWGPAGELLAETDETGVVKREYVYLGNLPVAQIDGATGEVFYIHADHLGTPQAVTDALGQLAWEDAYQPFGTATNTGAATAVDMDLRFPGQRVSAETGYHYNYFRDYDPTLGRYLQSDPIGLAGGLNTYGYVGSNPLIYVDPYGENKLFQWLGRSEKYAKRIPGMGRALRGMDRGMRKALDPLNRGYASLEKWVRGLNKSKVDQCLEAADKMDRGGLTKAGRALAKHGGRSDSVYPKATGNPASINQQGRKIVEEIVWNPKSKWTTSIKPRYGGKVKDVHAPDGKGIRFDRNDNFIGFLEP